MGTLVRFYNIPLLCLLILSSPTAAEEPTSSLEFKGIYDVGLGKVRFARVGLEMEQTPKSYGITSDIIITGILKWFTKHQSHTTSEGTGSNFAYTERSYESNYFTKKKHKNVKMVYAKGRLPDITLLPPEPPGNRSEIKKELLLNHFDPLLAILKMREQLRKTLQEEQDSFMLDVFDGRRMYRANFSIVGKKELLFNDKKTPVIVTSLRRELKGGFTKSELKKYDPKEPSLTVYFTDDERMMPIRVETHFWFGQISATLVKECRTGESCLFGLK